MRIPDPNPNHHNHPHAFSSSPPNVSPLNLLTDPLPHQHCRWRYKPTYRPSKRVRAWHILCPIHPGRLKGVILPSRQCTVYLGLGTGPPRRSIDIYTTARTRGVTLLPGVTGFTEEIRAYPTWTGSKRERLMRLTQSCRVAWPGRLVARAISRSNNLARGGVSPRFPRSYLICVPDPGIMVILLFIFTTPIRHGHSAGFNLLSPSWYVRGAAVAAMYACVCTLGCLYR